MMIKASVYLSNCYAIQTQVIGQKWSFQLEDSSNLRLFSDLKKGHRMTVYTSKITVSVVRAYSGSPPGKRGVKFHYSVNDADTTTVSSTSGEEFIHI